MQHISQLKEIIISLFHLPIQVIFKPSLDEFTHIEADFKSAPNGFFMEDDELLEAVLISLNHKQHYAKSSVVIQGSENITVTGVGSGGSVVLNGVNLASHKNNQTNSGESLGTITVCIPKNIHLLKLKECKDVKFAEFTAEHEVTELVVMNCKAEEYDLRNAPQFVEKKYYNCDGLNVLYRNGETVTC